MHPLRLLLDLNEGMDAATLARGLGLRPAWATTHLKLLDLPQDAEDRAYALDFLVGALQADTRQTPEIIRAVELYPLTDWGHHLHDYRAWKNLGEGSAGGDEGSETPTPANFGKGLVSTPKARYKELVKRHHPDANGGDRASEERFRDVIQAYRMLKQAGLC